MAAPPVCVVQEEVLMFSVENIIGIVFALAAVAIIGIVYGVASRRGGGGDGS